MHKYLIIYLFAIWAVPNAVMAQKDSMKPFSLSGYGEFYYSYNFNQPANHENTHFQYNYRRHNELNLNLAYLKAAYSKANTRANLTMMVGNYAQYNLATEPTWAQFIYEANAGFKLSKNKNIWVDVGILPSHIGFESAVGADCWTLTRSILAENSPYYQTGIKLSNTSFHDKINWAVFVLNGWQKISRNEGNQKPSFGFQFNYKPNSKLCLNYSNFLGSDKPDSVNSVRLFHNLYAIYEPNKNWGLTLGFDIGTDKYNATDYSYWFAPVLITKYILKNGAKWAARIEYYRDPHQIMIPTLSSNGFNVLGTSLNYDLPIADNFLWRIEGKYYTSKEKIFSNTNQAIILTTALSVRF